MSEMWQAQSWEGWPSSIANRALSIPAGVRQSWGYKAKQIPKTANKTVRLYWDPDGAWRPVRTAGLCKQLPLLFSKSLIMCSLPGYPGIHLSVIFWLVAVTKENIYYHLEWNIYTHTEWIYGVKYVYVYIAHSETNKLKGMFWDIWQC